MIELFKLTTFLTATGISFLVGFIIGGVVVIGAKVSCCEEKKEDDGLHS